LCGGRLNTELIKELYFRELETKNQHDSRPAFQVGALSILGGLLLFGYQHFRPICYGFSVAFWVFFVPALLSYMLSLIQVLRANLGHSYERLPAADILYDYYLKLQDYYARNRDAAGSADDEFAEFLARHMVLATSRNTHSNLSRSSRHYSAMRALAFTVVFAIASAVVVLLAEDTRRSEEPQAVSPPSMKGVEPMSDEPKPTQTTEPQSTPEKPPGKPPEPSNIVFKGTEEPPKQKIIQLEKREPTRRDDTSKK